MTELRKHWDDIFRNTDECQLGWHENDFTQTLKFLNLIPNWKNSKIFVVGAGTSGLIKILMETNAKLIINEISSAAISQAQDKYGINPRVQWLCHDISEPLSAEIDDIDIWLDRAVLHFLQDESGVKQYFKNVNNTVRDGGYAVFAEFSKSGATRCAGLDVKQYDAEDLCQRLPAFQMLANEDYTFINPKGDPRPYIYALLNKGVANKSLQRTA